MSQRGKWVAGVGLATLLAVQLVPIRGHNPPVTSEPPMSNEAREVLTRACFDCHSNRTVWPWYSRVAPLSWWIVDHVEDGRRHLNFSAWDAMPADKRAEAGEEIVEEVQEGKMPMSSYVVGHPEARLSEADQRVLFAWARSLPTGEPQGTGGPEGPESSEGQGPSHH